MSSTVKRRGESRGKSKKTSNRCWKGYEPVPGKKPYSKGSCRKEK